MAHSYLIASTGFRVAALQLCQLTVNKAITSASIPAQAKIHQLRSMRYAKFRSQLFIANHATGVAIKIARKTHFTKSLFNNAITCVILAPFTLRIPISLDRLAIA